MVDRRIQAEWPRRTGHAFAAWQGRVAVAMATSGSRPQELSRGILRIVRDGLPMIILPDRWKQ
jgi:hypothetical protein